MVKLFAILVLAISSTSFALTLKEKKKFEEWNEYLKNPSSSYIKTFKDKCGYDLPVTMEEAFVTPFMTGNSNAASYCDTPRSVMSSMCEDATSKKAITDAIKKVTCKYTSKKGVLDFKIDKKSKTLEMTVAIDASNLDEKTKTFLENNL